MMTSVDLRYDILTDPTPEQCPDGWAFFEFSLLDLGPGQFQILLCDPGQHSEGHAPGLPRQVKGLGQTYTIGQVYLEFIGIHFSRLQALQITLIGNPGEFIEPEQPPGQAQ